ncbi:MAG: hypothetical protein K5866_08600 [Treponema sp.]|nr:hypothetical protein [Treponema sp.]
MNTKVKNILFVFCLILCSFVSFSCTTELTLQLNKNGSVDIKLVAGAGEAFTNMILANTTEVDTNATFDVAEISYQLSKSGFTNVKVVSTNVSDISVSMSDSLKNSYLFTSGLASVEKNTLRMDLDPAKLKSFYNSADESMQMVLDLLLAPVFNDEVMTESEYIDVLASFYGESAAKEVQYSNVKITIINPDGSKSVNTVSLVKLLTLTGSISLK